MRRLIQTCLARQHVAGLGDALAVLQAELRPASAAAAACQRQWRHAASAAGEEQPPAAPAAAEAPAAPEAPAAQPAAEAAAAPAAKEPAAKPAKKAGKQAGKQPAAKPKQAGAKQQGDKGTSGKQNSAGNAYSGGGAPRSRLSGKGVAELLQVAPGAYFEVPAGVLPEATHEYYQDPVLKGENVHEPNFGCKAVQAEWEWSGRRALMARRCMQDLVKAAEERKKGRLYLDGWAGSGKSVALYSLVAWARQQGWLALYVPSAFSLVQNGTFARGEDGLWDTPEAARWVLASLRDAHAAQLADLKTPSGRPLSDLVEEGLAPATKPAAAVAAAVAAKDAVAALTEVPTLIAVDDYNALYSHTGYYESVHNHHRRQLAPDELRLVQAFRVLEQRRPANGLAVAAPTLGGLVSPKLRLPRPQGSRFGVPRFDLEEVAAAAEYFAGDVMAGYPAPEADALRRALFLTNGNARELRDLAPGLLGGQDPLGLSLGYKAAAAERRAADLASI